MIEGIAELDETLLELYLNNDPISQEDIIAAVRRQTIANHMVPVVCGSSYRNIGCRRFLMLLWITCLHPWKVNCYCYLSRSKTQLKFCLMPVNSLRLSF